MENTSIINFKENLRLRPSETDETFKRRHSLLLLCIYFISTLIIAGIISLIITGIAELLKLDETIAMTLNQTITSVSSLALTMPFAYKALRNDFKKAFKNIGFTILISVCFFILYFGIIALYSKYIETGIINLLIKINLISQETYNSYNNSINQQTIESMFKNNVSIAIVVPTIVVFGPLFEEIIFRKALFRLFNFKKNWLNIVTTGALFGLIHVSGSIIAVAASLLMGMVTGDQTYKFDNLILESVYFFNYFLAGILLGFIYSFTGKNIVPGFIVHLINNLLVVITLLMQK